MPGLWEPDGSGRDGYVTSLARSQFKDTMPRHQTLSAKLAIAGTPGEKDMDIILVPEVDGGRFHCPKSKSYALNARPMVNLQIRADGKRAEQRRADIVRKEADWTARVLKAKRAKSPPPPDPATVRSSLLLKRTTELVLSPSRRRGPQNDDATSTLRSSQNSTFLFPSPPKNGLLQRPASVAVVPIQGLSPLMQFTYQKAKQSPGQWSRRG